MSRPIQPSGTSTPSLSRRSVSASKLSAEHEVDRQQQLAVGALGLLQRLARPARRPPPRPASRRSRCPWARKKLKHIAPPIRIWSAISRKRSITPTLSETLAPPRTTTSGRCGRLDDRGQLGHLALQQQAGVAGQVVGDALGAGVGAVGGAEGVVDVEVGERGERVGQLRVVLGLPRLEAGVLEQQHVAGAERAGSCRSTSPPTTAGRLLHLGPEQLAEPLADRRQRERRVGLALRAARGGRRGRARRRARAAVRSSAAPPGSACRRRPRRRPAAR